MRVLVLGATGLTGIEFLKQALDQGILVTAFVRNSSKIKQTHENLKVIEGNIFDESKLCEVLKDHDAVVSCLGFDRNPQPVTGFIDSAKAVTCAMRENGISRLIYITSWFTDVNLANEKGSFFIRWVLLPFLKPVLMGMREMELYLENNCSDLEYTVVRPPRLTTGEKTGVSIKAYEENFIETGTSENKINRADVAAFMLTCLVENTFVKKMVAISPHEKK